MLSDQIITRKPPASYNEQYIRNVFFLFFRGGGGVADVKTNCTIPFYNNMISCESSFPLYFVMPGYQFFYKEYLLSFIIFGLVMHKNRKM